MRQSLCAAVISVLALGAASASAAVGTLNFEDGTDQGFGTGFGNDASKAFAVVNIGGSNRLAVPNTSAFQEAGRETSNPAEPFYQALLAASAAEAVYNLSYDYYIDTSLLPAGTEAGPNAGTNGKFLQIATYFNTGSGYYAQDGNNDVNLDLAALSSGQVIKGTITETFSLKGFDAPPNGTNLTPENFFRPGFIVNGDGDVTVYFDNITVAPVPEPTTLVALGAAGAAGMIRRRRA